MSHGRLDRTRTLVSLAVLALAAAVSLPASAAAATSVDYAGHMHRVAGTQLPGSGSTGGRGGSVIVRDHPFATGKKIAFALSGAAETWHLTALDMTDPLALDWPAGGDDELGRLTLSDYQKPTQLAVDPDFPTRPYLYATSAGNDGYLRVIELTDPDLGSPTNTDVGFTIHSTTFVPFGAGGVGLYKVGGVTYAAVNRWSYSTFVNTWMLVYDVTNPAAPSQVGSRDLGARLSGRMTLSGTTAFLPGQFDAAAVDLSNPASPGGPTFFGAAGLTRLLVSQSPPYVFAVGTADPFLHVYNASPPYAEVATLGVAGGLTSVGGDLVKSGSTLFCHTVDGVLAVDVTLPTAPVLLGGAEASGAVAGDSYTSLALAVDGDYAYALSPQLGLQVVDVAPATSPPTPPRLSGFSPGDVEVAGNLMVAADGNQLRVIDASLPEAPVLRSTTAVGSNHNPVVIGHHAFLGSGCNFQSWDLTNPNVPAKVSDGAVWSCFAWLAAGYDAPGTNPDCVYWGWGNNVLVFNVSSPASPSLATTIYDFPNLTTIEASGGFLYWLSYGGFSIWSLSTPTAPSRMGQIVQTFSGSGGIAAQGSYVYIGAGNTFYVVDASNPMTPAIVGTLQGTGDILDVVVQGTRAYLALGSAGMAVVDVSNPTAPKLAGCLNPVGTDGGYLSDLVIANDVILGSDGGNGLWSLPLQSGATNVSLAYSSPATAGNAGSLTMSLTGAGFEAGTTVSLTRSGYTPIPGTTFLISNWQMYARFNLAGQAAGVWNVDAANPNGSAAQLPNALTIQSGGGSNVTVTIVAPSARVDVPATIDVIVGNDGTNDASMETVVLTGIPGGWAPDLLNDLIPADVPPGYPVGWPSTVTAPDFMDDASGKKGLLTTVPLIPPGKSVVISVTVTPDAPGETDLEAKVGQLGGNSTEACENAIWEAFLDCAVSSLVPPPVACIQGLLDIGTSLVCPSSGCLSGSDMSVAKEPVVNPVTDWALKLGGGISTVLACAGTALPVAAPITEALDAVLCLGSVVIAADNCWDAVSRFRFGAGTSIDPNEKVGATGTLVNHYVTDAGPLQYLIKFENLATASLPARKVTITDVLSAELDLSTLGIAGLGFGDRSVGLPAGTTAFTRDIDLRPGQNLLVRATGSLDVPTRTLSIVMECLDPATQLPPGNALAGWLPPNVSPPEGEGRVYFTVRPEGSVGQGETACNQASIVFDTNAPIVTNAWCNTFDEVAPVSTMLPLAPVQPAASFSIQCSGSDVGSGIFEYDIHVSKDGAPSVLWNRSRTGTETFKGQGGHTYAFYSSAKDSAGNVEPLPGTPDATTQVPLDAVDVPEVVAKVELALHRVTPRPDGAGFTIDLSWPGQGRGQVGLFDIAGRRLWERTLDQMRAGRHQLQANPGVRSGMYWVRLSGGERTMTEKVVLIR